MPNPRSSAWRILLATLALALPASAAEESLTAPTLPTGTLVRSFSDPKVYYIQHFFRRWVESEEAFKAQGFEWPSVEYISDDVLARFEEGPAIKPDSLVVLPSEAGSLPDLAPFAAEDIVIARVGDRVRLKFTTSIWNRGKSAAELRTNTPIDASHDGTYAASQRIFRTDGSHRDRSVGDIYWHKPHNHFHYVNFADYVLRPAAGFAADAQAINQKTGFCLRDDTYARMAPEGERAGRTYAGCTGGRQGISVGWVDVYGSYLPDQFFDVTDLPAGKYEIVFTIDPDQRFAEATRDNNVSIALVDLDPKALSVKVLAFASPFANSWNRYPDGLLIQPAGDTRVYMVEAGRKRWLRTEDIFRSYERGWGEIHGWAKSLTDAIPDTRLVRQAGTGRIYALNATGWRRYVLSPAVMTSYGWSMAEVAEVSAVEMVGYPETDLVRLGDDGLVYSISSKKPVGTLEEAVSLGADPVSIHIINQTDFNAYGF